MIKPTVGRVLHFYPRSQNTKMLVTHSESQPLVALIAHVHNDTCVNVALFDSNGKPVAMPPTSVRLLGENEEKPTGADYCEWPERAGG
jgi:hypothetical protein